MANQNLSYALNPTCPQCGSPRTKLVCFGNRAGSCGTAAPAKQDNTVWAYRFWHCKNCTLRFNTINLTEGQLVQLYSSLPVVSKMMAHQAAKTYWRNLQSFLPGDGRLLVIGSGDGTLLAEVQHHLPHLELYGLDLTQGAIKLSSALSVPITTEAWAKELFPAHYFDFIVLPQTLEYLDRPTQKIQDILDWLRPPGKIFIFTRNHQAIFHRLLGSRSPIYTAGFRQIYTPQALNYLMRSCRPIARRRYVHWYPGSYLQGLLSPPFKVAQISWGGMEEVIFPVPAGNFLAVYEGPSLLDGRPS